MKKYNRFTGKPRALPSILMSLVLVTMLFLSSPMGINLVSGTSLMSINVSGVVNTYYDVTAVNVGNVTRGAASAGAGHVLAAGDCVVLIEMTGSSMGIYEILTVDSIVSSTVNFTSGPNRSYGAGEIQLVHMPCDPTGFTVTGDVTAVAWDGNLGGIVALGGSGPLTMNANIDASGAGFSQTNGPGAGSDAPNPTFFTVIGGISNPVYQLGGTGGGGGIIGGGGAGGGAKNGTTSTVEARAGTAATETAAGVAAASFQGANGGAAGLVGNGSSSPVAGTHNYNPNNPGVAGGGGGSYGAGAGTCGTMIASAYAAGGGGGGSYTGGGIGGLGGTGSGANVVGGEDGPNGNVALAADIPLASHYLHDGDARLMMGGAGGNSLNDSGNDEPIGGNGGGIIILDVASVNGGGTNAILANGAVGEDGAPVGGVTGSTSGAGGGAGGQMYIAGTGHQDVYILANGAAGGRGMIDSQHGPAAGGTGGGGGIWFDGAGADDTNSGLDAGPDSGSSNMGSVGTNVFWSVAGGSYATSPFVGFTYQGTTYTLEAWVALYNQAGALSFANGTTVGAELAPLLGVSAATLEADYPELFNYDNPKNAGLGCSPATGGTGLVRVSASAGTITIVKDASPNNAQDFNFTATGATPASFTLDDDADGTLSNQQIFSNLADGSYTFTESATAGWDLTNIACTGNTASTITIGGSGGFDAGDTAVTVTLSGGEDITCTFTNTEQPTTPACADGTTDLGGTVWRDLNANGVNDGEPGFGNVMVTAYDHNGQVGSSITVNTDGTYNFDDIFSGRTGDDAHIRLEFSGLPSGTESSVAGTNNGTTVQHLSGATCHADLGVIQPAQCPASNALVTNYPQAATCAAGLNSDPVMVITDAPFESYATPTYNTSVGTTGAGNGTVDEFMHPDWTAQEIGTVFYTEFAPDGSIYVPASRFTKGEFGGVGIDRSGDIGTAYASAAGGTFDGRDVIYRTDPLTGAPSGWALIETSSLGFGGVTYDTAMNSVYVVNLGDYTIYQLDSAGTVLSSYTPVLGTSDFVDHSGNGIFTPVSNYQHHPMGIDINPIDGRLYYSVVRGDLLLEVRSVGLSMTGAMTGSDVQELTDQMSVDILRGNGAPVAGDIDFSPTGRMAVGAWTSDDDNNVTYYNGATNSVYNHNAFVRIFDESGGSWSRTAITSVGQETPDPLNGTATSGVAWNADPSLPAEILWMSGGDFNREFDHWGVVGYDTTEFDNVENQENANSYIQFLFDESAAWTRDPKGNGGDVDIFFCEASPIEIGNYVWLDEDGDGVQDPNEAPIASVTVNLHDMDNGGTQVGSTTTDGDGEYYFNDANVTGGLLTNRNYEIRINTTQSAVVAYDLTTPNVNSGTTISDSVDSDGILNSNNAVISLTTGDAGENDHTFDFGFVSATPATPSIAVEKIRNTPDPMLPGTTVTFTIRITNTGSVTLTTLPLTDTYSTTYLTYVDIRTTPTSDSTANSGQIMWSDLTQAAPNGFGQDFGPGDVWDVMVEFVARLDTTPLPNGWTVNTAQVFTHTVTDTVRIYNPTNVVLSNREVTAEADAVVLSWSTVDETELVGFHVLHIDKQSGDYIPLTSDAEMILAEQAGRSTGADYAYTVNAEDAAMDAVMDADTHYILALVMADGTRMFMDMGMQRQEAWMVYLPVVNSE